MSLKPRPSAILADDHGIVRAGLKAALETPGLAAPDGVEVVAEVENGVEAIAQLRLHRPDLLFLDVSMPMAGGVEVLVEARRWSPETKVIVFTGITAIGRISELIQIGVDGLFSKSADSREMYAQIPVVLAGGRHVASTFEAALAEAPRPSSLTDRERQVLNLIVSGRSNKEIAEALGIALKTVDRHRTSLMQKVDAHSVAQLIAYALRENLIDPSSEV